MAEPWLSIIGLGEDGLAGLSDISRAALASAHHVFGAPRHLALAQVNDRGTAWDVPFDLQPLLALRGQPVTLLASGDPFWFGAGGSVCQYLQTGEWIAYPAPSTFSRAAAKLGWRLENVQCLGLHAAPLSTVRPWLRRGQRLVCLVRDAEALRALVALASAQGFGEASGWALERLGGPLERVRAFRLAAANLPELQAPLALAMDLHQGPPGLPASSGLPDELFVHDGQITKSTIRALTLRALAPRPGECLWDLGAGSGSISVEWCLAGGCAHAVEQQAERAANIRYNAEQFGLSNRLHVQTGNSLECLSALPRPDAVFVGGGFDRAIFDAIATSAGRGVRLVVNSVTLQTESLLQELLVRHGGELLQVAIAQAQPLGRMLSWQPSRPVVQWSVRL
ncbi:precorrin-6Y C5,15-methyltransferase (decarboxylating) subunit CbiT [Hydrogenophaga intermedia]|uniref:precorrin-6Y C5,15-methyltransferase (decarboxylating) subunit CbiT n=1 Tax=Hydrogenophaga intermedia TaxID=65786 RepID=UPI0020437B09|nr:precorrin-6Y C5,15-methyltransferase (decarboxylating) subunit CbiT [Hydrogenophaga intermedia]MCM3564737.1 precorrin-6Y C5,15-methyltransferase (decarboxylating) subunit CbiT [Hydrogenophaga intermedia]